MQALPQWKILGLMIAGIALVGFSVYLSQRWDVMERAALDFRGDRAQGSAERNDDGTYRLRLDFGERILSRSYKGGFGFQSSDKPVFQVMMAYNPQNPSEFQPATVSYVPSAVVGVVFILGMASILYARRIVQRVQREQNQAKKKKQ